MARARIKALVFGCFVMVACGLMLFSEYFARAASPAWLSRALAEVQTVCRDPQTQWMVVVCLVVYFVTFLLLERRISPGEARWGWQNLNLWLSGLVVLALVRYAFDYESASRSVQPLILFVGISLGKGVALWAGWRGNEENSLRRMNLVLTAVIFWLAVSALWQPGLEAEYQYRGLRRWTGPWDNPNIFGMLMGVGMVLAVGQCLSRVTNSTGRNRHLTTTPHSPPLSALSEHVSSGFATVSPSDAEKEIEAERESAWRAEAWNWLRIVFFLAAAGVMVIGLVKSYSRGAWLATLCGLGYFAWSWWQTKARLTPALSTPQGHLIRPSATFSPSDAEKGNPMGGEGESSSRGLRVSRFAKFLRRNWLPLVFVLVALVAIAFWNYRHTEHVVARRAFSVGNVNDFSWRNRLAAWVGSLQMIAEKPVAGLGWNQPEQVYDQFYRPPKVDEGLAIQMNDYLMMGTTLGLSGLLCFVAYVGLSLRAPATRYPPLVARHWSPQTGCLAGAIVLLVAFWFDGGLFKFAVSPLLWVLLCLGATTLQNENYSANSAPQKWRNSLHLAAVLALFLLGALIWAKARDPFQRIWFAVETQSGGKVKCVAVLPKTGPYPLPVVIFLHGSGGNLFGSGNELRQMAEMGLAAIGMEYNQTNEAAFQAEFTELNRFLAKQKWADTNATAWVGYSLGANRTLSFALKHPELRPKVLVRLAGGWVSELEPNEDSASVKPHASALIVHGQQDHVFPVSDVERVATVLRSNGWPVELKILSNSDHGFGQDRGVVFRSVGEWCMTHLRGDDGLKNYRSLELFQRQAKPLWLFCIPATVWTIIWLWSHRCKNAVKPNGTKSNRLEIVLRWVTVVLVALALGQTAIHLAFPEFSITDRTLGIARSHLLRRGELADFDYLSAQQSWRGQRLRRLLQHVKLANYNRELVNWMLDDSVHREFVLSPVIDGSDGEELDWRRTLWENLYPRIRRENEPVPAAQRVVRFLRERVGISPDYPYRAGVETIWRRGMTDEAGFERIYVAALRSVGIAARLNGNKQAELLADGKWQTAPRPVVMSW